MGLLLHDVGKLAVPKEIIDKPGRLTPEEQAVMQTHPEIGAQLLAADEYSPLVRAVVREHHERWDGLGYPQGLSGRHISQLARIASVADVYDAVTSERPYKPGQPAARRREGHQPTPRARPSTPTSSRSSSASSHPYPMGSELRLHDGTAGVVARVDPAHPRCPWVRFPDGERPVDTEVEPLAA